MQFLISEQKVLTTKKLQPKCCTLTVDWRIRTFRSPVNVLQTFSCFQRKVIFFWKSKKTTESCGIHLNQQIKFRKVMHHLSPLVKIWFIKIVLNYKAQTIFLDFYLFFYKYFKKYLFPNKVSIWIFKLNYKIYSLDIFYMKLQYCAC